VPCRGERRTAGDVEVERIRPEERAEGLSQAGVHLGRDVARYDLAHWSNG